MCLRTTLHFTPDGVSRTDAVITINMALLTEGQTTDHRLQSSDPFTISPTDHHPPRGGVGEKQDAPPPFNHHSRAAFGCGC
jgi:hypothetical protein